MIVSAGNRQSPDRRLRSRFEGRIPNVLREVAEYPNSFGPLGSKDERIDTGRYTLCLWHGRDVEHGPAPAVPARGARRGSCRGSAPPLRQRGRTRTQWEVAARLRRGLRRRAARARARVRDTDPYAVALALTREPPAAGQGLVDAQGRETFEEYEAAHAVQSGGVRRDGGRGRRGASELLPERFREMVNVMHAVWLDGELVCAGTSAPTEHGFLLYGGATLPAPAARGAYRALVRARWDDAAARGDAGAHDAGRRDVAPDPGAPRFRARRRGAPAPRRLREPT